MINFSRVEADIFVGSAPLNSVDVARLQQLKVTAVLSLQSDEDLKTHRIDWLKLQSAYSYNSVLLQRYPIQDFDENDLGVKLPIAVLGLHNLLTQGHRVYVHCNAGVCRAPGTILTYLCHFRGMEVEQGLAYLRKQRPQANPYLSAVNRALIELAELD
ncbi:MAG: dual specificity protein phosphatase family protein [Pseudomonadota bacterium]